MKKLIYLVIFAVSLMSICCESDNRAPKMNVTQNSTRIRTKIGIYDFGMISDNSSSPSIIFTIENLGKSDLNLKGTPKKVTKGGGDADLFIINQTLTNTPIPSGFSTTFTITFKPTSVGFKETTIVISNNDSPRNPYTFSVIGVGVSVKGDFNGDGFKDVLAGSTKDDDGGWNAGCAFIFFGKANMNSSIDASNADVKIVGENIGEYFGFCVASAGDVNSDGYDDILISSNNYSADKTVYIFFGKSNWNSTINVMNAEIKFIGNMLDSFGCSVSSAGDINNDTYDDIIIGARNADNGGTDSGCAYIFLGSSNWKSNIDYNNADIKLIGENAGNGFGCSVCTAGDVNNDGYDDVIVGANLDDDNGANSGCAFIFLGKQYWNKIIDASNADIKLIGDKTGDYFGISVASAGDVNNDDYDDVIVGAIGDDIGGVDAGCAFVFLGKAAWGNIIDASNADVKIIGEDAGDCFGCCVSSAGDVNNDSIDDIIIGAYFDHAGGYRSGSVFVFTGRANWSGTMDASSADTKIIGENANDCFGRFVSSAGDVNNDNFDDLIVGAWGNDAGGTNAGSAYVFLGGANWTSNIDSSNADVKLIGGDADDEFGYSIAGN